MVCSFCLRKTKSSKVQLIKAVCTVHSARSNALDSQHQKLLRKIHHNHLFLCAITTNEKELASNRRPLKNLYDRDSCHFSVSLVPRAHLIYCPTSSTVQILQRIICERFNHMCTSMNTSSSLCAKTCSAASHLSKLCYSRRSPWFLVPAPIQLFSQSPQHGSRLSNAACFSPWVHVALFVLVHVEVRVG